MKTINVVVGEYRKKNETGMMAVMHESLRFYLCPVHGILFRHTEKVQGCPVCNLEDILRQINGEI